MNRKWNNQSSPNNLYSIKRGYRGFAIFGLLASGACTVSLAHADKVIGSGKNQLIISTKEVGANEGESRVQKKYEALWATGRRIDGADSEPAQTAPLPPSPTDPPTDVGGGNQPPNPVPAPDTGNNGTGWPDDGSGGGGWPIPYPEPGEGPIQKATQMVMLGQRVINLIKQGKPVVDVKVNNWSVVPEGAETIRQVVSWKRPVFKYYETEVKNMLGMKMVTVRYRTQMLYGGTYKGKGAYLAHVTAIPTLVTAGYGFDANVKMSAKEILNMGTEEDPIAAIGFDVTLEMGSTMGKIHSSQSYLVDGNGGIQKIE